MGSITIATVCSLKGGVGKSTIALLLAIHAALGKGRGEHRSLFVDLDLEGTSLFEGIAGVLIEADRVDQHFSFEDWVLDQGRRPKLNLATLAKLLVPLRWTDHMQLCPGSTNPAIREKVSPLLWSESISKLGLSSALDVVAAFYRREQKARHLTAFLDCGPGMNSLAQGASELDQELDLLWLNPPEVKFRRIIVASGDRQALLATVKYVTNRAEKLAAIELEAGRGDSSFVERYLGATWLVINLAPQHLEDEPSVLEWLDYQIEHSLPAYFNTWQLWQKLRAPIVIYEGDMIRLFSYLGPKLSLLPLPGKEEADTHLPLTGSIRLETPPPLPKQMAQLLDDLAPATGV